MNNLEDMEKNTFFDTRFDKLFGKIQKNQQEDLEQYIK